MCVCVFLLQCLQKTAEEILEMTLQQNLLSCFLSFFDNFIKNIKFVLLLTDSSNKLSLEFARAKQLVDLLSKVESVSGVIKFRRQQCVCCYGAHIVSVQCFFFKLSVSLTYPAELKSGPRIKSEMWICSSQADLICRFRLHLVCNCAAV